MFLGVFVNRPVKTKVRKKEIKKEAFPREARLPFGSPLIIMKQSYLN